MRTWSRFTALGILLILMLSAGGAVPGAGRKDKESATTVKGGAITAPATQAAQSESPRLAPAIDRRAVEDAFQEFQSSQSSRWTVSWDKLTGLPRMLTGRSERSYGATPEAAALEFVAENRALLGLIDERHSVRVVRSVPVRAHRIVTLQQEFAGIDVFEGTIQVVIDGSGRVLHATNSAWPASDSDFPVDIGETAVRASIALQFDGRGVVYSEGPRRVIYPSGNGRLTYFAYVIVGAGEVPWRIIVDARTGDILEARRLDAVDPGPSQESAAPDKPVRPSRTSLDASDPCDREWVRNGAQVIPVPDPADSYYVDVVMGAPLPELGEWQDPKIYAAGIKLLPCIQYTIELDYDLHTWSSYNNNPGWYFDVFFVEVDTGGWYWQHGLRPTVDLWCETDLEGDGAILPGTAWVAGGDLCGDHVLCSMTGAVEFQYLMPDCSKEVYLSVGLDRFTAACPSWGTIRVRISALSRVFNPNPTTTLNRLFTDQEDANSAVPGEAYSAVDLLRLTVPIEGQPWRLNGLYCAIKELVNPVRAYTTARDPSFPYLRNCDMFEAVNAYHHITQNQLYIQSLGFLNVNNRAIDVDPHILIWNPPQPPDPDNSQYNPIPVGAGRLEFGEGGVDDAEDADVVLHEYGHAIQDNQRPGLYLGGNGDNGFGNETRAMGEGFGDYWACSSFEDKSQASGFDPAAFGEFDKQNMTGLRRVDEIKTYPTGMADLEHRDGEIWSRTLWDLFHAIGKMATDIVVLESHFLVPQNPLFSDGAKALLAADELLCSGANEDSIVAAYVDRGIFRELTVLSEPVGVLISVFQQDVRGDQDGIAAFERVYAWGDTVILQAPPTFNDLDFIRWEVEGASGGNGNTLAVVEMDHIPESHLAIAVYDTTITGIGEQATPASFALHPNLPNPFNPYTLIGYDVPAGGGEVTLRVYDVSGRLLRTLVDGPQSPGTKTASWDGTNERGERVASGVYFCRMTAPGYVGQRKLILLK
ncbi:MAG: M36 family metallopeptidase [Chitinivibrionia bacterium]|nr:M36 family metallopeptidase [Chitinivibrionia bacterium]